MRRTERVVAYSALAVALIAVVGQSAGLRFGSPAVAAPVPAAPAPDSARLATCDIYALVERLVESDAYAPARNIEQERIKARLAPMEEDLKKIDSENAKLREELAGADSKDPNAQMKLKTYNANQADFESKIKPYNEQKAQLAETYSALIVGQFTEAYQKVIIEAKKTATEKGFTYVVAQKRGDLTARNPQQLVEEFLARPISVAPADSDITEAVRVSMKLPEKAAGSGASPMTPMESPRPTPTDSPAAPKK
jgi:hypothetical protein